MNELKSEFQTIILPPASLADMYGQHLVLVDEPGRKRTEKPVLPKPEKAVELQTEPVPETILALPLPEPGAPITWLGNFTKQVLVVVNESAAVHCSDSNLEFLGKILAAVGLSIDHIALLNLARNSTTYLDLKKELPAKAALYFGVEPASLGVPMRFPQFQVQPWDSCTFLYAPALSEINGSATTQVELKKQLWVALKKIFG